MAGKSKNGGSGLLLLAGLGVGAFLLFNKPGGPPSGDNATSMPETGEEIPAVPKFVAVNTAATESPLPTGIVSDEDGMMPAAPGSPLHTTATNSSAGQDEPDEDATPSASSTIPAVVSTKLTEKEKAVIQKGVLSDELAVKRPDLYKAIYVRKHGQKGKGQQALKAADSIIQQIKLKSSAVKKPAPAKKRKVAIKLNTKIAPKRAAVRKAAPPSSSSKPAPKPLVLVKRPAPKAKHAASKSHPVRSKAVAKHPVRKHVPTHPSGRPRH